MIAGKGQTKERLFQSGEFIQEKGIKLPMNNSRFQTSFKEGVTASVKRKSVQPTTSIAQFLDKQQIHNEHDIHDLPNYDEIKCDNHTIVDVKFMHAPIINEHNKGLDDFVDQEELGGDECDVEEEIDIDCSKKAKDNNKEPSKHEMFIATRTKTGKEIQANTQAAIVSFLKRISSEFD
ncbi:hypothetical protein RDI58_010630 [Solanum bulbocastanum]|uniref:Uncharacterized protein n=1 Tax=Solanum bulbocastanum TaxID=147425 RepID=A0AAN8TPS9_SOLBU